VTVLVRLGSSTAEVDVARTRTNCALEVRHLTVSYRSAPVLWEVSCAFPAGRMSAIVGPNGAGKSTLLKAALGLVPADAGRVLIEGAEGRDALDRVAYVPQRESVDWDFPITVREVVEMGRYRSAGWFRRLGRADRALAAECLDRVGMAGYGRRQIGQLSGGQRQRVFLARALAQQASVLLMDEPFAGIDARTQSDLLGLLGQLRDDGTSVIVVHHDMVQVRAAFDWALLLNVRALGCGPTADVLTPDAVREAYGADPTWTG
jgi:manganese/zinc/iron transport system ATP- binding protein